MSQAASERDIRVTVSNIYALARHLLNLGENDDDLHVVILPGSKVWGVAVRYASFAMQHHALKLEDALETTLRDLMSRVMHRLQESERLIASLKAQSIE